MAQAPKTIAVDTQAIIGAWNELAPTATFAGLTLAQYRAAVQPSFDTRKKITELETDLKAQMDARDQMDVVKTMVADNNFGDDNALYKRMGYVRKSTRQSGLTRKKKAAPVAAK
jgi:hypothetical protein